MSELGGDLRRRRRKQDEKRYDEKPEECVHVCAAPFGVNRHASCVYSLPSPLFVASAGLSDIFKATPAKAGAAPLRDEIKFRSPGPLFDLRVIAEGRLRPAATAHHRRPRHGRGQPIVRRLGLGWLTLWSAGR